MDGVSLLSFLDAPLLVGDPEGRIVYVNPAFERRFCSQGEEVRGDDMASLFAGGGREAILSAVAEVCSNGETVRFRMREEGHGYLGLASPIEARADRVGVVILLFDEPAVDERLVTLQREIQEPLDEALTCFEELIEQTGGRRSEAFRISVERGLESLSRARKWTHEMTQVLRGRGGEVVADASVDPVRLVRQVVSRVAAEFAASGVGLDLLVPAQLPAARGEEDRLESALVRALRLRMGTAEVDTGLTLSARVMGAKQRPSILIAIVDRPRPRADEDGRAGLEPRSLVDAVEPLGGHVRTIDIEGVGRATAIQLELAPSA